MRYQSAMKFLRIQSPSDGLSEDERKIIESLFNLTVAQLYRKLPTHRMKTILALHFEAGYDQETIAEIFDVSQEQIALEVKNIRNILKGGEYKARPKRPQVNPHDLLLHVWAMSLP